MRLVGLTLSLVLLSGASSSADVFDVFQDLHPVETYLPQNPPAMMPGGDSCYAEPCCSQRSCGCPPAPLMIGDSMGIPFHMSVFGGGARMSFPNFYSKVADNNSAIPQDRIFMTFQFFNDFDVTSVDGVGAISKRDLRLNTVGFEKTFAGGLFSGELIVPYSYSPSPQFLDGSLVAPASQMELQNVAFGLKGLLYEQNSNAISAGLRVEVPTAANIQATDIALELQNESFTITPYLAMLHYLGEDTFFQAFAAYRIQTNDEWVVMAGTPLHQFREPAYLNLDAQLGHWIYRNHGATGLTGLQAKVEVHYTGTFEPVRPQGLGMGIATRYFEGEQDFLNLTTGLTAFFNDRTSMTLGLVTPVRNGSATIPGTLNTPSDRIIDWELAFQVNYYLGQ